MTRLRVLILFLVLGALAAYPGWRALHGTAVPHAEASAEVPQTVADFVVTPERWQSTLKAFGQVRAVQGADLSSQVAGIVDEIDFQSGQEVKAGAVLLRLRLYDDTAKLAQLNALVALWTANMARDQKQFDVQAISRATLDLDLANLRNYQAQAQAQAQAMDEKIVRAPFAGKLGIRQVDLGQYLPPGTAVTSLQALDPIYVDFNVSQQQIGEIVPGHVVQVAVDTWPGRVFEATVQASDSRIDPQSRMVTVRASLPNKDHALLPGMFAIVHLDLGRPATVLAIPQAAISFNPYGNFVYVLTKRPDRKDGYVATSRVVVTGEARDSRVVVTSGLQAGELVVGAGQLKLRNGASVVIDNTVRPDAPSPADPVNE